MNIGDILVKVEETLARHPEKIKDIEFACTHDVRLDKITGLPHAPIMEWEIETEIRRALRYKGNSFSVVYIDADNLKLVNDSRGHHAGDQLIRALAELLFSKIRNTDSISRWYSGGDEFVILMPETHYRGAYRAMRRIQSTGDKQRLRFSFGVCEWTEDLSLKGIIHKADKRMRQQKKRRSRAGS